VLGGGVVVLARVLDVDHDAVALDDGAAGLGADRDGEEALGLAAALALDGDGVEAVVGAQGVAVGGDPQVAVLVEREVVGAGDRGDVLLVEAAEVGVRLVRVAAHEEQVPGAGGAGVVVVHLQDQAVLVLGDGGDLGGALVGAACAVGLLVDLVVVAALGHAAVLVVRQGGVDLAGHRRCL